MREAKMPFLQRRVLVGLNSRGPACVKAGVPEVVTDVHSFLDSWVLPVTGFFAAPARPRAAREEFRIKMAAGTANGMMMMASGHETALVVMIVVSLF